jgi:predicted nucleic acid-binding protein
MPGIVLDASFALAFVLPDVATPPDAQLLVEASAIGLLVPALWWIEVGHTAMLGVRHGRMTEAERRDGLARLASLDIETDSDGHRATWNATTSLTGRHRLSLYDASCIELALRRGTSLATLDAAMRRAADAEGIALLPACLTLPPYPNKAWAQASRIASTSRPYSR